MTFTRAQIQTAYKKLSNEVQSFITSMETASQISQLVKNAGLSPDQVILADGEIFSAMVGLQTLDTAINKISEISDGKDLTKLKSDLNQNIFSIYKDLGGVKTELILELSKEEAGIITPETRKEKLQELDKKQEWINELPSADIPEIPPTNLPMVEEGETVHDVSHIEQTVATPAKPDEPKVSIPDYRYEEGKDPYREPLK